MSIKMKLVSCISAFIIVLGIFIFGVLSAEQATVNLGGSISFEATDVYARVTGEVQNAQTNPTLNTLEFSATNDTPDQSSWSGLDLQFDSRATDITIEVTVENLSMERSLTVNVTDALATPVDNLGKTILLDGASYVSGMNKTIPVATAADASNTSKVTFTITLDVLDHNKSLPSTTFDYDINLYDENSVPVVTYQPFEFEVIGGIGNEVRITSHNGFGNVVIPASFSFDTTTPVTSFIMQDFNGSNLSTAQMTSLLLGEFYYTEEGGERTKTNMLELESLAETLTFPITVEPTYRYEFDGYSEINAILLLTAISAASEMGSANNVNFYFTNDEFTEQTFTAEEFINYIMENYPDIESGPAALAPLFSTTGLTILETDPIEIGNGNIIDGTDYIVKEIGDRVFSGRTSLNSITIPESVTSIGNYAFEGCSGLTSIIIPSSVTSIGNYAFSDCTALTEINYNATAANNLAPDSNVFYNAGQNGTGITVNIGANVTRLPNYIFGGGSPNIITVNFTEGSVCESIGDWAFDNCSSLTSITILEGVTSIGYNAFSDCSNLTSITIPLSVVTINGYSFSDCSNLTSITIPEGVTSIGEGVFRNCSSLTSITIPDSVTSIGEYAFNGCSNLTSVTIPDSVISIGNYAFSSCRSLTSITIPDSVTSIGDGAFYYCSSLTSITIPDSVTSIGTYAFSDCSNLTSITIPLSVVTINGYAFSDCSSLTSITIPDSVTSIGTYAFYNCTALTEINYNAATVNNLSKNNNVFYNAGQNGTGIIVNIGANVTKLPNYLFSPTNALNAPKVSITTVNFAEGSVCESIGDGAFSDCSNLTSITIPESVTSIGDWAFSNCSSLTSITIPEGVTSIGEGVFRNCSSLTSITIPEGVTSIGDRAFQNCSSLTSITLPSSVTSIGDWAFLGCYALAEVYNYSSLTVTAGSSSNGYLGQYAKVVYKASDLTGAKPETRITVVDNVQYYNYGDDFIALAPTSRNVTEVILDNRATEINQRAFQDCSSLTSVNFENNSQLTSISEAAFLRCNSLASITIPESVKSIGNYAFNTCSSLTSITIPESVTSIGYYVFTDCSSLVSVEFKNTTGWFTTTSSSATSGEHIDVTDPAQNATNLTSAYQHCYWKRG